MNIHVAHLSHEISEDQLRYAFSAFGQVRSVTIVRDADTGEAHAQVSMPIANEAQTAIRKMNGTDLDGQTISVEARAKTNVFQTLAQPVRPRTSGGAGAKRSKRSKRGRAAHGRSGKGRNSRGRNSKGRAKGGKRRRR